MTRTTVRVENKPRGTNEPGKGNRVGRLIRVDGPVQEKKRQWTRSTYANEKFRREINLKRFENSLFRLFTRSAD